jgi:anti-sigma regulatory factor (Ser/Thr protein kinase)
MTLTETYRAKEIRSKTNFPAWLSGQLGPGELKMLEDKMEFKLKNRFSELDTLCQNLERFGDSLGLSKKVKIAVNLSLDELITNIISYGHTDNLDHWIKVAISCEDGLLIIRLEDDGIPFNPVEEPPPDLEAPVEKRSIGQLGIHFTKHFMDDLKYERRGNKNSLTMIKNIRNDGAIV